MPFQHSCGIHVEEWLASTVCKQKDRACDVLPYSGQRFKLLASPRKSPAPRGHCRSEPSQACRASLPQANRLQVCLKLQFWHRGQRRPGWKAPEKPMVEGVYCLCPGALQQRFGDDQPVQGDGLQTPGEFAPVSSKPNQKAATEGQASGGVWKSAVNVLATACGRSLSHSDVFTKRFWWFHRALMLSAAPGLVEVARRSCAGNTSTERNTVLTASRPVRNP